MKKAPYMQLGQEITQARKKMGWTKAHFSRCLDVEWDTINKWENGVRRPKPDTLMKICGLLELDQTKTMEIAYGGSLNQQPKILDWPHQAESGAVAAKENIIDYVYWIFYKAIERFPNVEISLCHPMESMVGHEKPIQRRLNGETNDAECYWECVDFIAKCLDIAQEAAKKGRW